MLVLLMRYYLYFIDNNHDLDVDLIFFNVVQFDCAHFNNILKVKINGKGQGQCVLSARARKSNYA